MATSTLLSLLYVPVAYTYFDSLGALVGRVFSFRPRWPFRRRDSRGATAVREGRPTQRAAAPLPVAGGASVAAERVQAARGQHRRPRSGSNRRGPAPALP
jgi:hypothetical protein